MPFLLIIIAIALIFYFQNGFHDAAHIVVTIEHAGRAQALENRVWRAYRQAVAGLFSGPEDIHHVMEMLKLREIYRHLSNCGDRGDEAANVIHGIVVKNT